jgi:hypothetical protein
MSYATFMDRAVKIIETAMKLKAVMKKRGLARARAKCPYCEKGFLHGQLAGSKGHLHMACDGCDVRMME